ncbi:uncharacterized protein CANTADRAFT_82056 [Suhomyces tanzawaensis NRRL Y-17324]|uniref:Zn(2)-C6 fungal-type domain-containing protein n=1 Tax=Suhomyces tanzawaensis NRRL Y-17324 TaxID=984487 RepID=A0A1E4SFZ2_9ASCO|nr:uncharacterized protein CANTADRAFT_82056 [Suhomyces tanzawaensis NRRL Y-17324]ODV78385.1 hypothetical protein CANTADRAFT_82056 [Suhomyces tanzawaensis NRRL Y-17324]
MVSFPTERRKKVTQACDYCKKRKYKCIGKSPCELCKKKNIVCQFSIVDRRTTKGIKKILANPSKSSPNSPVASTPHLSIPQINTFSTYPDHGSINKLPPASKLLRSTYIPKSLQPLLSFPLNAYKEEESEPKPVVLPSVTPKQDDVKMEDSSSGELSDDQKVPRILFDSATSTRYIGESSPLSLLFEARNIFMDKLGVSDFSSDDQGINMLDEPIQLRPGKAIDLPAREHCDKLLVFFQNNVNQSWYIFNMSYFTRNVIDHVYRDPVKALPEKLALLHLVISLGLLFAEISRSPLIQELAPNSTSVAYFESGFNLIRSTVDDGKLWLTEAYFLIYFYYQTNCNRSTSWLMLGTAIRNAQALGLHRKFINESYKDRSYVYHRRKLWVSLYVCDRISSILLGRPLLIADYDWDDFDNSEELVQSEPKNALNIKCLIEIAKVAVLNGKIVQNFYLSGTIDPVRAEKLAIDFKIWSINLDPDLQIDKILRWQSAVESEGAPENVAQDNFLVFAVHLSQLYGIMLLCRPFFMYLAFKSDTDLTRPKKVKHHNTMIHFCKASVKSSVLTITLINYYIQQYSERVELYPAVNCCFMAALILGLSILHRKTSQGFQDEYSIVTLMEKLVTARNILNLLGPISVTAHRFSVIASKMINSLEDAFASAHTEDASDLGSVSYDTPRSSIGGGKISPIPVSTTTTANQHNVSHNYPPSANSSNLPHASADLESLMDFQLFFVPSGSNNNKNSSDESSETSRTNNENVDPHLYNIGTSDILFDNNL